ncbi:AzlC family ABC transporter permease [Iamia sp. SCSIO 61187]|uniref:AzlC family ABC transporter permease n=1 Tax=Iamia sp. SCSIO 61187 TaxID=2722752 RepID=UPI001C63A46A|nr:AzlC family ABC transporter permease [Iamia sp. SCSIO 61187]QYG92908.1 AzlC family ABC transporter permease [Iamia sp. SCSIO 61187]
MTPERRAVITDALTIGAVTGAYGGSFGAVAVAAGLSPAQACALSLLMFTGGSQFAMVGTIAGGGGAWAGAATAALLGARNAFYGLELAPMLRVRGLRRLVGAHLVIDESSAMGVAQPTPALGRLGFWATGAAVFVGWNAMTLVGAVGASALDDPGALGLDVAGPAAFVALLAPRLAGREPWVVALLAAALALAAAPLVPAGVPVLVAAAVAVVAGLRPGSGPPAVVAAGERTGDVDEGTGDLDAATGDDA